MSPCGRIARRGRRRGVDDAVMIGQEVARVAIGRRSRPFRQHGVVPGLPVGLQPIEDVFLPILEIAPLTWVLDHIEENSLPAMRRYFQSPSRMARCDPAL